MAVAAASAPTPPNTGRTTCGCQCWTWVFAVAVVELFVEPPPWLPASIGARLARMPPEALPWPPPPRNRRSSAAELDQALAADLTTAGYKAVAGVAVVADIVARTVVDGEAAVDLDMDGTAGDSVAEGHSGRTDNRAARPPAPAEEDIPLVWEGRRMVAASAAIHRNLDQNTAVVAVVEEVAAGRSRRNVRSPRAFSSARAGLLADPEAGSATAVAEAWHSEDCGNHVVVDTFASFALEWLAAREVAIVAV